jgi:hypothetical protein
MKMVKACTLLGVLCDLQLDNGSVIVGLTQRPTCTVLGVLCDLKLDNGSVIVR